MFIDGIFAAVARGEEWEFTWSLSSRTVMLGVSSKNRVGSLIKWVANMLNWWWQRSQSLNHRKISHRTDETFPGSPYVENPRFIHIALSFDDKFHFKDAPSLIYLVTWGNRTSLHARLLMTPFNLSAFPRGRQWLIFSKFSALELILYETADVIGSSK